LRDMIDTVKVYNIVFCKKKQKKHYLAGMEWNQNVLTRIYVEFMELAEIPSEMKFILVCSNFKLEWDLFAILVQENINAHQFDTSKLFQHQFHYNSTKVHDKWLLSFMHTTCLNCYLTTNYSRYYM
jgi:hypothetical protein